MQNFASEIINKLQDRRLLLSVLFGSLSLVLSYLSFGEWGSIKPFSNYDMAAIFTVYFITGIVLFQIASHKWAVRTGKEWIENTTEKEKELLSILSERRTIIPQELIDEKMGFDSENKLEGKNKYELLRIYATLELLYDAGVVYSRNINTKESPIFAYNLNKWAWDLLRKKPCLLQGGNS